MTQATPATPQPVLVDINELFRQKGELVTQFEIIQMRLQGINQQINQIVNQIQQAPVVTPPK